MDFFDELCNRNEPSPLPGPFPKGISGVRKTAWRACHHESGVTKIHHQNLVLIDVQTLSSILV